MDTKQLLTIAGYASSVSGIIGAFLVASNLSAIGYPFFIVGSITGTIASKGNIGLQAQFVAFTCINFYGFLRVLL